MVSNKVNAEISVPVEIVVKATVNVNTSPKLRQVARKAVAGLSEAELIERNSIGTYREEDEDDADKKRATKKKD